MLSTCDTKQRYLGSCKRSKNGLCVLCKEKGC